MIAQEKPIAKVGTKTIDRSEVAVPASAPVAQERATAIRVARLRARIVEALWITIAERMQIRVTDAEIKAERERFAKMADVERQRALLIALRKAIEFCQKNPGREADAYEQFMKRHTSERLWRGYKERYGKYSEKEWQAAVNRLDMRARGGDREAASTRVRLAKMEQILCKQILRDHPDLAGLRMSQDPVAALKAAEAMKAWFAKQIQDIPIKIYDPG